MPLLEGTAYDYRSDPDVPDFDDGRALFLFDGVCVLCSSGSSFLMRHDNKARIAFASAQSAVGRALYAHYGMPIDESYLLIVDGRGWTKSDGYFRLFHELGGPWRLLNGFRVMPRGLRDWVYDLVARNRYRWFGKSEYCELLTPEQRKQLLDS
ncbi:thiol-disulfide oxidoreductase DCC family protein [Sphingomonas sp. SM33]|uniref:Thiol-disulfide oxidoreductase DCC family protein n=1 Tax=Sphingomonas telluris TaxID=2907998 RepID=A0ABS9VN46_9SPHN|nr:thiol-disulfide oxidoreductase DCC family protein [Sphingomonas telluris]MCH8616402.1 thiol-disulfide oxidoreductase DCC family protein [Sphingomonas telluris]